MAECGGCAQHLLVTKSAAVADCQSWRIQSRTRELPLAIVMLALCRNSDFFLRASQPVTMMASSTCVTSSRPLAGKVRKEDLLAEFQLLTEEVCDVSENSGDWCAVQDPAGEC